jgi:hypothetical protein
MLDLVFRMKTPLIVLVSHAPGDSANHFAVWVGGLVPGMKIWESTQPL